MGCLQNGIENSHKSKAQLEHRSFTVPVLVENWLAAALEWKGLVGSFWLLEKEADQSFY